MKRLAIITGASSGIGKAFAQLIAQEDLDLLLVARSADQLAQLKEELQTQNHNQIDTLVVDLTQLEQMESALRAQLAGRDIKYLINNAGFGDYGLFEKADLALQMNMIDLNIKALTIISRIFLDLTTQSPTSGQDCYLLNLASIAAFIPGPLMSVYCATKAYVLSFTRALAFENRTQGRPHIHILALCPGPTRTNFIFKINQGLSMTPEQVARYGYNKLRQGKKVMIPGLMNRIAIFLTRLTPGWLQEKITYIVMRQNI